MRVVLLRTPRAMGKLRLFRLGGAQISGGKNHEAQTLPFKAYMVKLLAEHCGKGKR